MSELGNRVLSEAERARALEARRRGGLCAGCGRRLAPDEPVWLAWFAVGVPYGGQTRWWMPVGAECASAAFRAATDGAAPERCAGCGRGVYYERGMTGRRRRALCSRACARPPATSRPRRRYDTEPVTAPVVVAGDGDPPWVR